MHPAVSRVLPIINNLVVDPKFYVPVLFTFSVLVAEVWETVQHSLLRAALSWALIWIYAASKAGIWPAKSYGKRSITQLAGALLALGCICDSAASDKQGTWALKVPSIIQETTRLLDTDCVIECVAAPRLPHIQQQSPLATRRIANPQLP